MKRTMLWIAALLCALMMPVGSAQAAYGYAGNGSQALYPSPYNPVREALRSYEPGVDRYLNPYHPAYQHQQPYSSYATGGHGQRSPLQPTPANPYSPPAPKPIPTEAKPLAATVSSGATTSYTVQPGDTLYRIAQFFEVSLEMLLLDNAITDPTKLQIGQRLSVPAENEDVANWLDDSGDVSKVFYATLTAYTAGYESTGKKPGHPAYGITASGAKVKENHTIAVDPKVIPLGTLVYIEGIGVRKAEDTGSAIKGNKIDVYIPDVEEAIDFGVKKQVKVYVLDSSRNGVKIASAAP